MTSMYPPITHSHYSMYLSFDFPRESEKSSPPQSPVLAALMLTCQCTWLEPANLGVAGDERKLSWLQSDPSLAPLQAALVDAFSWIWSGTGLVVQLQQGRYNRGDAGYDKSRLPHCFTKGQGSCSNRSRLRSTPTNEVTLINLIKYFIRVVMVNYQLLKAFTLGVVQPEGLFPVQPDCNEILTPFYLWDTEWDVYQENNSLSPELFLFQIQTMIITEKNISK